MYQLANLRIDRHFGDERTEQLFLQRIKDFAESLTTEFGVFERFLDSQGRIWVPGDEIKPGDFTDFREFERFVRRGQIVAATNPPEAA